MIWWLWTAFNPTEVHMFDVENAWRCSWLFENKPDVYWLGECAWTTRRDNMRTGLR